MTHMDYKYTYFSSSRIKHKLWLLFQRVYWNEANASHGLGHGEELSMGHMTEAWGKSAF